LGRIREAQGSCLIKEEKVMAKNAGGTSMIHYGWIVIFMGMLTTIGAHGFGRMAYTLILPPMKDGLQFSYAQLGLLGTGNFIGYLSLAIIGGFLAARFGTRIVITLALILMGMTMILTGFAQSFGFAFMMRLLTGFGNGAAYVPAMALGSAWFEVKRLRTRRLEVRMVLPGRRGAYYCCDRIPLCPEQTRGEGTFSHRI
jgi:MFS family permease